MVPRRARPLASLVLLSCLAGAASARSPGAAARDVLARVFRRDGAVSVRAAAARHLARGGDLDAREALRGWVATEPREDAAFREAAAGLGELLAAGDDAIRVELAAAVEGASSDTRRGAAGAALLRGGAAALPVIGRVLADPSRPYEAPLAKVAAGPLAGAGDLDLLEVLLLRYPAVGQVGKTAFDTLRVLARPRAEAAVLRLLEGDVDGRGPAVRWLASLPGAGVTARLVEILAGPGDLGTRAQAAAELAARDPARFAGEARGMLDPARVPPGLVAALARALGGIGDAAAAPRLRELLGVAPIDVRRAAAAALGALGWEPAREDLIQGAGAEGDPGFRAACMAALAGIPGDPARDALGGFLREADPASLRRVAARALEIRRSEPALAILREALRADDAATRAAAAGFLGEDPRSEDLLLAALASDPDATVRRTAAEVLRLAGGERRRRALVAAQADADAAVRQAAMFALMLRDEWARPTEDLAVRLLRGSPAVMLRSASLQLLARSGTPRALDALGRGAVHDAVPGIRAFCHLLLDARAPARSLEAARATLAADPRPGLRRASAARAGKHGAAAALVELRRAVLRDRDPGVRRAAVHALGSLVAPLRPRSRTAGASPG